MSVHDGIEVSFQFRFTGGMGSLPSPRRNDPTPRSISVKKWRSRTGGRWLDEFIVDPWSFRQSPNQTIRDREDRTNQVSKLTRSHNIEHRTTATVDNRKRFVAVSVQASGQRISGHRVCLSSLVKDGFMITAAQVAHGQVIHWARCLHRSGLHQGDHTTTIPTFDRPAEHCGISLALVKSEGVNMDRVNVFVSHVTTKKKKQPEWYRYVGHAT